MTERRRMQLEKIRAMTAELQPSRARIGKKSGSGAKSKDRDQWGNVSDGRVHTSSTSKNVTARGRGKNSQVRWCLLIL